MLTLANYLPIFDLTLFLFFGEGRICVPRSVSAQLKNKQTAKKNPKLSI